MSKNCNNIPPTKKIYINNQFKYKKFLKKKSKSQMKYSPVPDIITQIKPCINNINNLINSSNSYKASLTPNSHSQLLNNDLLLPNKSSDFSDKKTLVLDLDETLVHSSFTPFGNNDIVLNVDFDGMLYNIYVLVRPGVEYFIKTVAKYYEIVIFTASLSNYASPLLDILDKNNNIKFRLFRENCTYINGTYIKELKRLNRNLKYLVIVDNSPLAYTFDIDNGLPIKTWYDDKNDTELYKIINILEFLSTTNDVRYYIKKFVKRNEIIYNEALNLIKTFGEKNIKNLDNTSLNNINNSVNLTNILINTSNNNENSANYLTNISTSKKIFNIKNINKNDENSDINIEPLTFLDKTNNIEIKNNILEDEKNFIKNKSASDNQKKSLKASLLYNHQNKNKKHNLFPINDIKKNNFFENKKINEKQKYKNSNIFRLKKKHEIKQNSNSNIMSNINIKSNTKIRPIMPITLSTTNIKSFSFNTTKNILLKTNKSQKKDDTKLALKNNYISIIQDKKEKRKYTNLLKQINNDNIKNNLDTKKIFKYEKFNLPNTTKSKLRVSSSVISHRNYTPLNKHQKNNRIYISFNPQRSKSSGHFFDKKNTTPRAPSGHMLLKNNEHRKFDYLFEKIYSGNTSRYNSNLNKNLIDYKYRRIQTAKKLKN